MIIRQYDFETCCKNLIKVQKSPFAISNLRIFKENIMLKISRFNFMRCLFGICLVTVMVPAAYALDGTLLVVNKSEDTVSLIDFPSATEIVKISVGATPHEVDVSPDGKTAIVANYGSIIPGSTVSVIDIQSAKVIGLIRLKMASRPHGIQWLADGKHAVVTTEGTGELTLMDIEKRVVIKSFKTGQAGSHMVAVGPDQKMAYVANLMSDSITAIDLSGTTEGRNVKTGKGSEGIAITPDGSEVWVSNRAEDTLTILDAETLTIKDKIPTGKFPIRVVISSNNQALVTNAVEDTIEVFDVKSRKRLFRTLSNSDAKIEKKKRQSDGGLIPVGIIAVNGEVFVANTNVGTIAHFRLSDMKLLGVLSAGINSDGLSFSAVTVNSQ